MLTTRRMEHGTPLLADFDLGALMGAQERFQAQDESAIADFIRVLSTAGKTQAIRKLSAVVHATEDQLRQSEADPKVMPALEEEAALRPFAESFKDAVDFFGQWGASFVIAPASSAPVTSRKSRKSTPAASPSVDS